MDSVFESIFIELVSKQGIIVGLLYWVPNSFEKDLIKYYKLMLNNIQKENEKEILMDIDQNLDLLKSHIHSNPQIILEINIQHNMLMVITRLTWVT